MVPKSCRVFGGDYQDKYGTFALKILILTIGLLLPAALYAGWSMNEACSTYRGTFRPADFVCAERRAAVSRGESHAVRIPSASLAARAPPPCTASSPGGLRTLPPDSTARHDQPADLSSSSCTSPTATSPPSFSAASAEPCDTPNHETAKASQTLPQLC